MPPGWLSDNADSLMGLFQLVLASSLDGPRPEQMNLSDLMNLLTAAPDSNKPAPKDVVYAFELLEQVVQVQHRALAGDLGPQPAPGMCCAQ